jgi:hypothetical protein
MQKMESAIRGKGFNSANWKPCAENDFELSGVASRAFYLAVGSFWTVLAQVMVLGNMGRYA